jgi:FixJ family two-component response regulator
MSTPIVHVIDDDDGIRRATARLLSAAGFTAQTHQNGTDFLATVACGSAGCIILDVRMPGAPASTCRRPSPSVTIRSRSSF